MADDQNEAAAEGEEGGKKKGSKLIIIIIAVVLLLGGGGAAAYFFLLADDPAAEEGAEAEEEVQEVAPEDVRGPAIYVKVRSMQGRPMFVVPLQSEDKRTGRGHYMQAYVEALTRDPDVEAKLKLHMPVVVSRLNQVFAAQSYEVLMTAAGREKLQALAVDEVRKVMVEKIGRPGIETILFTNLVMQ